MKILLSFVIVLVFVFESFASPLVFKVTKEIQAANRKVAGTITDKNNRFIAGVQVKAVNISTKKQYKTKTDELVFFEFANLPLGTYKIKFAGKRFLSKTV